MAVTDEVREEEVLACVVLKSGKGDHEAAESIFNFCSERLAYFKAPGWIWFADSPADDRNPEDPEARDLSVHDRPENARRHDRPA